MCGRFAQFSALETLKKFFPIDTVLCDVEPSYNVAPTQEVLAIIRKQENQLVKLRWGLVPFWAKNRTGASRLINARLETVRTKPSFRHAFKRRRCLIIADGFFEWQKTGNQKQPWFLALPAKEPFAFAGLWDVWKDPDDSEYASCTIITAAASEAIQQIHHRMPVIIPQELYQDWLNPHNQDTEMLASQLLDQCNKNFSSHTVSKFVNSPKNNEPACIDPLGK
jgi:putative SOS response-associated peptidase YedK